MVCVRSATPATTETRVSHTWRETDHPRDPNTGEFVEKQGWAGRVVTAMFGGRRVQGRDIRTKLDYDQLSTQLVGALEAGGSDPALHSIVREQGFDGTPEVISALEMERRIDSGWHEMWRGVRGYTVILDPDHPYTSESVSYSSRDAAQQFREGDYFAGRGVFGNGTYASVDQTEALGYGDYMNGGLLRIALDSDAKVADFDELLKLGDKYNSAYWATGMMIRGFKTTAPDTPQRAASKATSDRLVNKTKVLTDLGRLAAAMGYDAIAVQPRNHKMRDGRTMYYIILNRTAVAVQEAEDV